MKIFDIYYSGVVSIEAETEEEALIEFNRKYFDYGDVDDIVEEEE